MRITEIPFAVLRFQYHVVRLPLQLIEDRVVARMGSEAPGRLLYERTLGVLDATVGNALGDRNLKNRGSALAERSDALSRAARLDAAASLKEEHADAELKAQREKAIEVQKAAREKKEREVEETLAAADERKRAVADAADERTAAAKRQADELAAKRKDAAESAKRDEQARIQAAEQQATAAAESKLDRAQAKRKTAATKRAQADRVAELADAEKENRQTERANNA